MQRVVPGRDRANHASGLTDDERVPDSLACEIVAGQQLDVAGEHRQRRANLNLASERERRAHVGADRRGHGVRPRLEKLLGSVKPLGALGHRSGRPAGEGCTSRLNRSVHVRLVPGRDAVNEFRGRGVDDIDATSIG